MFPTAGLMFCFLPFLIPCGFDHHGDGAEEDLEIHPGGESLNVEGVVLRLMGGVCRQEVSAVDLGPAGDAGADLKDAEGLSRLVQLGFASLGRSVTDEAHLKGQQAEKLGKLVDGSLADKRAHLGDMLLYLGVLVACHVVVGLHGHTAEFDTIELLAAPPDAFLHEEDRAGRIQLDGDSRHQKQRRQDDQRNKRDHEIHDRLHGHIEFLHRPKLLGDSRLGRHVYGFHLALPVRLLAERPPRGF